MNGILDLETVGVDANTDTWIMRLPKEVCNREGFSEGTLVSLTIKNGGIQSQFIRPKPQLKEISNRLKEKNRKLYEELERIGD
jgi:hypothetical protein